MKSNSYGRYRRPTHSSRVHNSTSLSPTFPERRSTIVAKYGHPSSKARSTRQRYSYRRSHSVTLMRTVETRCLIKFPYSRRKLMHSKLSKLLMLKHGKTKQKRRDRMKSMSRFLLNMSRKLLNMSRKFLNMSRKLLNISRKLLYLRPRKMKHRKKLMNSKSRKFASTWSISKCLNKKEMHTEDISL